jgi:hypothetical protein
MHYNPKKHLEVFSSRSRTCNYLSSDALEKYQCCHRRQALPGKVSGTVLVFCQCLILVARRQYYGS